MKCERCGTEFNDQERTCPNCGLSVTVKEPETPEQDGGGKKKKIEDTETEAASYRVILRFLFPSAVHPGYQDIDSGAGTGGNGGHQQLQGKNKGQGRQPVKGVLGHKVAVHNIVDGLDQQGQHDGRA